MSIHEKMAQQWQVSADIHPADFIFQFICNHPTFNADQDKAIEHYFANGADSAAKLQQILADVCCLGDKNPDVLEFASGYGCVTRHLSRFIPNCNLTSCDIHEEAVRFIRETLDTTAVLSTPVPENLHLDRKFDVVFALSFFSHMPRRTFGRWLHQLASLLKPGGFLIFTTHGLVSRESCFPKRRFSPDGFYFIPSSEQEDLDPQDYGFAATTPEYVLHQAFARSSLALRHFVEGYWWGHQDLYVFRLLSEPVTSSYGRYAVERVARGAFDGINRLGKSFTRRH